MTVEGGGRRLAALPHVQVGVAGAAAHDHAQERAPAGTVTPRCVKLPLAPESPVSMADFYAALRSNRAPTISGVEGTDVMAGCEMIIQSAQAFLEQTQRREALHA